MVTVPSQYQSLITGDAQATGLPVQVVAAQVQAESAFNPNAVSSTGAEGMYQFEPGTYQGLAANAGVPSNSEFNPAQESKVYIAYMNQLLQQEGGSVFKALEAYNAGPGNLNAGSGYATGILKTAGQSTSLKQSPNASTDSINVPIVPGFSIPIGSGSLSGPVESVISDGINAVLQQLGVQSIKDLFQRLGLILLGAVLLIVGIRMLMSGGSQSINITTSEATDQKGNTTTTRKVKHPFGQSSTTRKVAGGSIEGDAVKAAAIA